MFLSLAPFHFAGADKQIRSRHALASLSSPLPSGEREPSTEGARRERGNRPRKSAPLGPPHPLATLATSPHWGEVDMEIRSRDALRASSVSSPLPSGEREPSTKGARRVRGNRPRKSAQLDPPHPRHRTRACPSSAKKLRKSQTCDLRGAWTTTSWFVTDVGTDVKRKLPRR